MFVSEINIDFRHGSAEIRFTVMGDLYPSKDHLQEFSSCFHDKSHYGLKMINNVGQRRTSERYAVRFWTSLYHHTSFVVQGKVAYIHYCM